MNLSDCTGLLKSPDTLFYNEQNLEFRTKEGSLAHRPNKSSHKFEDSIYKTRPNFSSKPLKKLQHVKSPVLSQKLLKHVPFHPVLSKAAFTNLLNEAPLSTDQYELTKADILKIVPKGLELAAQLKSKVASAPEKNVTFSYRVKHFIKSANIRLLNLREDSFRIKQDGTTNRYPLPRSGHIFVSIDNQRFIPIPPPIDLSPIPSSLEDPRIFRFQNKPYIVTSALVDAKRTRRMFLYDIEEKKWIRLSIPNNTFPGPKEKNWTPYEYEGELYFIYSYMPLCVLKVVNLEKGICNIVKGFLSMASTECRGSTSLLPFKGSHYVAFGHSRGPWRPIPIVYDAEKMELLKIGMPFEFPAPKEAKVWRKRSVQFPYDLQIKKKFVHIGMEYEDRCPTWIKLDLNAFKKLFAY